LQRCDLLTAINPLRSREPLQLLYLFLEFVQRLLKVQKVAYSGHTNTPHRADPKSSRVGQSLLRDASGEVSTHRGQRLAALASQSPVAAEGQYPRKGIL